VAFTINTNIASLQSQEYLRINSDFQTKTIGRVTSGLRILSSGDDAAGLAIANTFRSDQAVLTQGIRNANDGLSQLQIIDGGLNNISKLLDRARTLATQSASGTFTGSRTVLNDEFATVLGEIDRQAQAIGLDAGGTFARSLSVFIGGGRTNGSVNAISNGSVGVDLTNSTVDSKSLGLKGVQVKGVAGTDIGTGSSTTSLAQILANSLNSNSQAVANTTVFTLRGPGFGGQGVAISVSTSGVGSTTELVTRVNAAIDSAAAGGTASATALANANIRASVVTDSSGRQQLAFTSPSTAFQVEAGDRTASALLGVFERNATITATDTAVNVNTNGATALQLTIDGGTAFTVNFTDNGAQGTTSKGDIVRQLNADSTFAAQATAYLEGNQLVIKSKGNSSTSSIAVTSGTLATRLGLSTTTQTAKDASTGADRNVRVQANGAVAGGATARSTNTAATLTIAGSNDNLNLTVAGKTANLTLTQGTALTKEQIAADINAQITASGTGANGLSGLVTASVVSNQIVLTAANAGDTITIAASTVFDGFTVADTFTSNVFYTADAIKFRFQGGGLQSPVDIDLTAATAGTTTVTSVLTDLISRVSNNSQLQAAGITLVSASEGNNLVFKNSSGETFQVSVTGDTYNKLGFGSFKADASAAFDYTTITAGTAFSGTFDPAFTSQTSTLQFSLNGAASSGNSISVTQLADRGIVTGTALGTGAITLGSNVTLRLLVDGTSQTVTLTTGDVLADIVADINAAAIGVTADIVGTGSSSALRIRSNTTGSASSVVVEAGATNAATALGLTIGQVGTGNSAATIRQNIADQINTAIAGDAELRNADLRATFNGSNQLVLASNNGTYFRVTAYGNTDLGYGNSGSSFTGTQQQGATAVSGTYNSNGADTTTALTFSDLAFGADDQIVTITASDPQGVKQSLSVTLRNDATLRNARTIDDAVKSINDALQQSNNSTLTKIVAVKENTGGAEKIRFVSVLRGFEVGVGSTAAGTGIAQPTGGIDKSAVLGTGANSTIDTQSAAEAAVTALANAVSALGSAQAAVGKGQNNFNFAVNLASSQLTNLAASESRIRDADLAQEAANLTKAQIVSQAGIAALAQANSAPQAVLALLRG